MTTLYRPVLIKTAGQAEALPVGTLAVNSEIPSAAVRIGPDEADGYPWLVNSQNLGWHSHIVGHIALVPIEAEETRSEGTGWIVPTAFGPKLAGAYLGSPDGTPPKRYTQTTWRTPWEETP